VATRLTPKLVNTNLQAMNVPVSERMTAEERRHAILMAAQPLFAARGFEGVTTREVAEAAGVSEALLYRHFQGKADLYDAVQTCCIGQATTDARRLQELPDSTATLVLACYLVMRNIELGTAPGGAQQDVPRLILRSLLEDGVFARGFVKMAASHFLEKLERCIRAGIEAGEIEESFDHALTGAWFAHHLAGAIVFYRLPGESVVDYPGAPSIDEMLDRSVRFALRGLGLTRAAIEKYYQPAAFALLRGEAGRP
jgi:AcrR family transcriptional regulator